MKKNYLPIVLFIAAILLPANIVPAFSQNILDNYLVKISLSPSQVDKLDSIHKIGYVNLVNKNGLAVKAPQDIAIGLESDDPSIASVPAVVTIKKDNNFGIFEIETGNKRGETIISTLFNDKIDFKKFKVGGSDNSMPDDVRLELSLPTNDMHVNSEMPFSVYLETVEGDIIRAPYDVEIDLEFESSLLFTNEMTLTIQEGDYYAWGVVNTNDEVGNGFLRASFERFGIDTAENIEITSSLPTALKIEVFPKQISSDAERTVDVFVSLVDSDGLPSVTPEDVPIELFSDEDNVGSKLDDRMKAGDVMIKKGEFGYHFREKMNLAGFDDDEILVGASAEDLGIALSHFEPVESLNIDNPLAVDRALSLFVLPQMPSNTTALLVYQVSAVGAGECIILEIDEDTGEKRELAEDEIECPPGTSENDKRHSIEKIDKDALYPVQTNENFKAEGLIDKINIVSSDDSLIKVEESGNIESAHSYGTAIISSGDRIGSVTLAVTIKGFGAGTTTTEVVDVFKHVNTEIFSPTGKDNIVIDKNGYFDLFLIALDGKQRPKILDENAKYILNPVNEVVEIKKNHAFASANFHSDSFDIGTDDRIEVNAVPIGVEADLQLESSTSFGSQISSSISIMLPFENLDAKSEVPYHGVVQLKDLLGNPGTATKDLRIQLGLDGANIVNIPEQVTIQQGSSYATFPISANGQKGDATIDASIKGVIGTQTKISTTSNDPKLKIFAEGIEGSINAGEPTELTIFVDDDTANSVPDASLRFVTDPGVTISPESTRTDESGSAKVDVTVDEGELISIQILASASGYVEDTQNFDYTVEGGSSLGSLELGLPDWVLYVGVAAMVGIGAVLLVFLKKPKTASQDEDEDYEYEYEEEI
jgi:hypothetical protein